MERLMLCFPKRRFQDAVLFLGEEDEKVRGPSIITCYNSKWNSLCRSSQTKYDDRRKKGKKVMCFCSRGEEFFHFFFYNQFSF